MQTKQLHLASGIPKLALEDCRQKSRLATRTPNQRTATMTKTVSIGLLPADTLFGRFMAAVDRMLMASANAAIRNGDLPYFGL
jgi:hypothetical protein